MDDMISRQAAIDAINDEIDKESHFTHQVTLLNAKRIIEQLPSATRKGKWIRKPRFTEFNGKPCKDEQPDLECDQCGFQIGWWDMRNYCANCGADMRGEQDECMDV